MPWQVYNSAGQLLQATDLPDSTVTASKLATNAVTNAKVADDAIDSAELVAGSVDTAHIAGSQITNALMADDAIGVAELSATGTASSSTFLRGDNAWAAATSALQSTRVNGSRTIAAGSGTQAITGAGFAPTTMLITALDKVSTFISWGWGDDGNYEAMVESDAGSFTQTDGRLVTVYNSSGGVGFIGVLTSLDADGCTITWTKLGAGLEINYIILFLR